MKRIILGSNSPRRRELLAGLDIPFTVDTGNTFEEDVNRTFEAGMNAYIIKPFDIRVLQNHVRHFRRK